MENNQNGIINFKSELEKYKQEISFLNQELSVARVEIENYQSALKELNEQLLHAEHQKSEKIEENYRLMTQLEQQRDTLKQYQQQQQSSGEQNSRLRFASASQANLNSSRDQGSFFSVFKTTNGASVQRLQPDSSKKEFDGLANQIKKLNEQNDITKRNYQGQILAIQLGQKKLEDELKSKENSYKNLQKEFKYVCEQNDALTKRLIELQKQYTLAMDEIAKFKEDQKQMPQLEKYLNQIEIFARKQLISQNDIKTTDLSKAQEQKITESTIIEKQVKSKINSSNQQVDNQSSFQSFKVTKIALLNSKCLLILRKNIFDNYIIEIETAGDRQIINALEITDLIPDKVNQNQFSIVSVVVYTNNKNQIGVQKRVEAFSSIESKNICRAIKSFLLKAQEDKKSEISEASNQSKGLLRGIVSLFGGK